MIDINDAESEQNTVRQYGRPLYRSRHWLKLISICQIGTAIISVLSFIGILIAWLYVWLAITLWKTANNAEKAYYINSEEQFVESQRFLKQSIIIFGVLALINITSHAVYMMAYFVNAS